MVKRTEQLKTFSWFSKHVVVLQKEGHTQNPWPPDGKVTVLHRGRPIISLSLLGESHGSTEWTMFSIKGQV